MLKRVLLSATMAVPLASCLSFGTEPPEQLLTLTPVRSAQAGFAADASAASALAVLEPGTDQRHNVTRVPVRTSDSSLAYLKDAVWVERPSRLFQDLLAETIRSKGNRLVVREDDLGQNAGTTLSGRLLNMGYDVATASVVVGYDAILQLPEGQVRTRRFESRIPAAAEVAAVGPALNQAANEVADQVADWVG